MPRSLCRYDVERISQAVGAGEANVRASVAIVFQHHERFIGILATQCGSGEGCIRLVTAREKLIDESPVVSKEQPILELNTDDLTKGVDTDEFFHRAAAKMSTSDGAADITKSFSSLDGLLGKTGGGIPDGTKPILMPTDLLFDYNEWELREEARLSMMKLGFIIQTNPGSRFIIEGHTDTIGGEDPNYQLSLRRAGAVRDWLINTLKIDGNNMQAVGYGKTRPLVKPDGTAEEQALNRRVEIMIKK